MNIECAEKMLPLYTTDKRYINIEGGRSSTKTTGVADFLLSKGIESKSKIICGREIQNSIKNSVHSTLAERIQYYGMDNFYKIKENEIIGKNGTEFLFYGLYRNLSSIKSVPNIRYLWVEEADRVSRESLKVVIPTIREEGSQIIFTYNWTGLEDPVHVDYVLSGRKDVLHININYWDNPWFSSVSRKEMEYDRSTDPDKYKHVWEGQPVTHSAAQIFYGKWSIQEFEAPEKTFFYFGADWGFSQDPTTLIRAYVQDKTLFIDYEYYGIGLEITAIPAAFLSIPEVRNYPIFADSARPDTISHVRNNGLPKIQGAEKGKGSIEDGIEHIKGYKQIIIHPRCKHTIDEFRLYSYVTDKQTGLISNKIEDKNNHCIDALRYALNRLIKNRNVRISSGDDINFL